MIEPFEGISQHPLDAPSLLALVSELSRCNLTRERVAELILETTLELMNAHAGKILLCDRHTLEWETLADRGGDESLSILPEDRLAELIQRSIVEGEETKIAEVTSELSRKCLGVVFRRKRIQGAIVLTGETEFAASSRERRDLLKTLAKVAAGAFERLDIESEQKRLLEIFEEVGSELELSGIFKRIEDAAKKLFKCDGISILERIERSESNVILRNLYDSDHELVGLEISREAGGLTWWTIHNKKHLLYMGEKDAEGRYLIHSTDVFQQPVKPFLPPQQQTEKQILICPVEYKGQPFGAVRIYNTESGAPFDNELDPELLGKIGIQAAIAIRNAEEYERARAQKTRKEELERAYDELEKSDQERKRAFEELEKAYEAMKNNNRLMSIHETVTSFAHDARSSLHNITPSFVGMKDIIKELIDKQQISGKTRTEAEDHLRTIERELTNLANFFEKLNNYARILETRKERNSINKAIDSVLDLMKPLLDKHKIELKRAYQQKDYELVFDKGQIEQVISNIVLNSIQAMERKGIIYIGTELTKKSIGGIERLCVEMRIADEGTGIKFEHRPRIFDAFFTTKTGQGTGFGLTLCKKIVEENHEGYIDFKSEWGKGTIFYVYLPYEM
jgi:signal transduction histidine kinase